VQYQWDENEQIKIIHINHFTPVGFWSTGERSGDYNKRESTTKVKEGLKTLIDISKNINI
jgi:hypothetical protein